MTTEPNPGEGGPRLASESLMNDEVVQAFAEEARGYLDEAGGLLRELEADTGGRAPLRRLWQIVHTLKGTAGILGQESVSQLAHRMEDLLKALDDHVVALDRRSLGLLFVTSETLEDMIFTGSSPPELPGTLATYDQLLNSASTDQVSTDQASTDQVSTDQVSTDQDQLTSTHMTASADLSTGASVSAKESLRVPVARLDGLVRLASEISTQRASFDLRVEDMGRLFGDLHQSVLRLSQVSRNLFDEYRAGRVDSGVAGAPLTSGDSAKRNEEFDALEMDRYTEIDVLSQELTEAASDVETAEGDLREALRGLEGFRDGYSGLTSELQDRLLDARLVPFSSLSARLHRTVRVTARQQAKQVALILEGETVEIDKSIIEEVAEPLLHLMRNAIDHGIEAAAQRRAAGKAEKGEIRVGMVQEGADVLVRVSDDGGGLDFEQIRRGATEAGILTADEADQMNDEALSALIFRPGFSTARTVSRVSGRGVGLDAVREAVRRLRGQVEVRSASGRGSLFEIRLPRSLTLTRALLIRDAGQSLAVPLSSIDHVRHLEPSEIEGPEDRRGTSIDGEFLPVLSLATALGLAPAAPVEDHPSASRLAALVLRAEGQRFVVLVQRVLRVEELVIQSAEKLLRRSIHGLSGAALRGDGRVVLVVHPDDLARLWETELTDHGLAGEAAWHGHQASGRQANVLIVDDSLTVRKVLNQVIEGAGWRATTARDGVDAWEKLETGQVHPDVVVLDLEMPRMDGFELTTLLRAHAVWRQLPILILTSRAAEKHRRKAFDLGVDEYLVKPYREKEIVAAVRRLVTPGDVAKDGVAT